MDLDSATFAVDAAMKMGASYADARLERAISNGLLLKNGIAQVSGFDDLSGIGIRVLVGQTLGFSCTNELSRESIRKAVEMAIKDSRGLSKMNNGVRLSAGKAANANYEVKEKIKLDSIGPGEKLAELMEIEKSVMKSGAKVPRRYFSYTDTVEERFFANSEGSRILSKVPRVNIYYFLTVVEGKKSSQRYWQNGKAAGFEAMKEFNLQKVLSDDVLALQKNMKTAVKSPKKEIDAVVGPQITGIMVHESGGHPYEADRILGREAAQAGESFMSSASIGEQLGNNAVSISDDPTLEGSFGFYLYDDEGIKAGKKRLMVDGKISQFLHSRESSAYMMSPPNASARAKSFDREPIPRMSNTFVEPGNYSEEELIEEIKNGVYIKNFTEWNIDDRRVNQKYVGAEAYLIKNGRLTTPVASPTIEITTHALYKAIDAVANNTEFHAGTCGKGEPMQGLSVWFGGPSMRIRRIRLK